MLHTNDVENTLFLRAWLRAPLRIGSLLPSSSAMGRAFAKLLDLDHPGDVLELGSGTGAISQGLLDSGLASERLTMVESEPELVAYLRQRFPHVRILEGDATEICAALDHLNLTRLNAVVSSLPIVWFPLAKQRAIIDACLAALGDEGIFLQMTNAPTSPLPMEKLAIGGARVGHVWRNLPPSFIWRYWRR